MTLKYGVRGGFLTDVMVICSIGYVIFSFCVFCGTYNALVFSKSSEPHKTVFAGFEKARDLQNLDTPPIVHLHKSAQNKVYSIFFDLFEINISVMGHEDEGMTCLGSAGFDLNFQIHYKSIIFLTNRSTSACGVIS